VKAKNINVPGRTWDSEKQYYISLLPEVWRQTRRIASENLETTISVHINI
jgi:hypothetical protein